MRKTLGAILVACAVASTANAATPTCHQVYAWLPAVVNGKLSWTWQTVCKEDYPNARTVEIPR